MVSRITTSLPATAVIHADGGVVVTGRILEEVASRILDHFGTYFPDHPFDPGRSAIRVDRLGQTSSYPLFVAEVSPGGGPVRHLIIKFPPVFAENNEGLTEFEHLRAMHAHLGEAAEIRVPRPLDFFEDCQALVTERVGGERFSHVLLRDGSRLANRAARARLHDTAHRCGAWLAAFHKVTRKPDRAPFDNAFVAAVGEEMDAFTALGLDANAARLVTETTRRLNDFGRERRIPAADQHGDYGPQNLHVGDGHIYVFDLNYRTVAPVYEDLAYFLVTLETMNPYPRHWFFDRRRVAALRAPFLSGYFGDESVDPARDVLIEGYYLKALAFRCSRQRSNTSDRGAIALALFDAFRLRGYYQKRLARQCRTIAARLASLTEKRL